MFIVYLPQKVTFHRSWTDEKSIGRYLYHLPELARLEINLIAFSLPIELILERLPETTHISISQIRSYPDWLIAVTLNGFLDTRSGIFDGIEDFSGSTGFSPQHGRD